MLFSEYLLSGQVPGLREVNDEEPLFTEIPIDIRAGNTVRTRASSAFSFRVRSGLSVSSAGPAAGEGAVARSQGCLAADRAASPARSPTQRDSRAERRGLGSV